MDTRNSSDCMEAATSAMETRASLFYFNNACLADVYKRPDLIPSTADSETPSRKRSLHQVTKDPGHG